MSLNRDEHIYMAKVCEQTERFDDMLEHIKEVLKSEVDLSVEERNLLSVREGQTSGVIGVKSRLAECP